VDERCDLARPVVGQYLSVEIGAAVKSVGLATAAVGLREASRWMSRRAIRTDPGLGSAIPLGYVLITGVLQVRQLASKRKARKSRAAGAKLGHTVAGA